MYSELDKWPKHIEQSPYIIIDVTPVFGSDYNLITNFNEIIKSVNKIIIEGKEVDSINETESNITRKEHIEFDEITDPKVFNIYRSKVSLGLFSPGAFRKCEFVIYGNRFINIIYSKIDNIFSNQFSSAILPFHNGGYAEYYIYNFSESEEVFMDTIYYFAPSQFSPLMNHGSGYDIEIEIFADESENIGYKLDFIF